MISLNSAFSPLAGMPFWWAAGWTPLRRGAGPVCEAAAGFSRFAAAAGGPEILLSYWNCMLLYYRMRHLRWLRTASFPLTCGEALTSFCGFKVFQTLIFHEKQPVKCFFCLITPTFSPASLLRVLFMISSRRCPDQTSELCSC